ncbi:MlaD family protein [Nocardioides stalactiti]|uniref:MlaD family protein n=1 Tax=Nocardioides stalactiti TaxID=2755356 RepID=UPI001601FF6C|nr:MlaD family protein [Nocardioides stalactiti]
MSKERSDRDALRLGIVGMAAVVLALAVTMNLDRLPLVGGGETYHAEFAETSGLQVGEEVRIAGVKVGEVTELELDAGKVRATFRVRGEDLGDETTASIEVKTLLGQHYVSLEPAGDGLLDEGDTIPLSRTTTPVDIVPAVEQLTGQVADIDVDRAAEAFDAISATLRAATPQARRLLGGLGRLSQTVASRDRELRSLFQRAAKVSEVVAARDDDLTALLRDSADVLGVLERRRATVTRMVRGTAALAQELRGLVDDVDDDLGPVLADLDDVLEVLVRNRRDLDRIITYAALYAREFVNVAGTGPWFDTTVTLPAQLSVCAPGSGPLDGLVAAALQGVTELLYGTPRECLPLGSSGGGR